MTISESFEKGLEQGMYLATDEWFRVLMNGFHVQAEACDCILAMVKYRLASGNDVRRTIANFERENEVSSN